MRILAAQINPTIGDFHRNTSKILAAIDSARTQHVNLVVFPELAISGYPPEDFLLLPHFIEAARKQLDLIIHATQGISVVVGLPRLSHSQAEKPLFNSAAIISDGKLLGFHDKILLPSYDVFSERRYFEPGNTVKCWEIEGKKVAVVICEDQWRHVGYTGSTNYQRDPIEELKPHHPDLLINISASPYSIDKFPQRLRVASEASKTLAAPSILCNQVGGNDNLIFDGYSLYVSAEGELIQCAKGFEEDNLLVDLNCQLAPCQLNLETAVEDIYHALVLGVRDYFHKSGFQKACLGLSGGVDSALVACIAVEALGKEHVLALLMPSRYSSPGSVTDAMMLIDKLDIAYEQVPIESPFEAYLDLLSPYFGDKTPDTTEENIQARIRGMILMAFSNKLGYIVLSTANKSEMALGYSTLYGDLCGGLAVINDLTKQQVYALSNWINRNEEIIPWSTILKPPSAELKPDQKDSDSLPDYAIVDTVVCDYIERNRSPQEISFQHGYPLPLVQDLIQRIHRSEYKRRQTPPGLRISEKAFSIGRRFPIVESWSRGSEE
jgi:NAD+ synthase (glutamine-hydrolysing)